MRNEIKLRFAKILCDRLTIESLLTSLVGMTMCLYTLERDNVNRLTLSINIAILSIMYMLIYGMKFNQKRKLQLDVKKVGELSGIFSQMRDFAATKDKKTLDIIARFNDRLSSMESKLRGDVNDSSE